ncbi:hypothetical protein [Sporisorium scitamineum]|uniref:Uncharacterized protein n=1 Tax=Sporisorium scitamineum TaxID=49012 RepID=A0A0F7RXW5_9BASI|nr:hypothetical protein [Sporisorium scitamineum]
MEPRPKRTLGGQWVGVGMLATRDDGPRTTKTAMGLSREKGE